MPQLPSALRVSTWIRATLNHPYRVILFFAAVTAFFALQLPKLHFKTSIYEMAIEDLPETERYREFKEVFGCEELILVVIKTDGVFEPRVFQLIEHMTERFSSVDGVRRVVSLAGIKKDMELSEKWDLARFQEIISPVDLFHRNLLSTDKKTTGITLVLEDIDQKDAVIHEVDRIIQGEKDGAGLYQIGMPIVSAAMAEYVERDFLTLPPFTFLIISVILLLIFRSLRGLLVPAGSVLIALVWTFGTMGLTGTPLSMLTMIVPIFVIAVGTAYCMYIFPEYLEAARETDSPREAARLCFYQTGFPTFLAVVTTSIGLGSLLLNRIVSIRSFAVFSVVGIWSMTGIMLFLLPAVLSVLPLPGGNGGGGFRRARGLTTPLLEKIVRLNLNHQKVTIPVLGGLALLGILGIFRLEVETNPVEFFKEDTPVSRHFHDVARDLSGSTPVNILLDGREADFFEKPENIELIARIQGFLAALEGVDKTISFADYFKLVNYASNKYQKEFYSLPREDFEVRMLMNDYKSMLGQDMFERFMTADLSRTNILLRTHLSSSEDFLETRDRVVSYLSDTLGDRAVFQVTGFGVVISQSSDLLTRGQIRSLSLTLILIFAIMFLLFLSLKVGFIAILPNCFPIIMNFGIMGWFGIELSVATSLIASIAIGLAVDDTIHYLVRYNREFREDLKKNRALEAALLTVGRPILFTTITIGAGFSILTFSHFEPTAVFGLMMVITMASALVGDLILLPSLMTHVELITVWDLLRLKLGKDPRKGIPLFNGLSRNQAHYILMAGNIVNLKGGEVLFRKGETSDSMYAVISGGLEVVDVIEEEDGDVRFGTKKLINTIDRGGIVGEMGMVRSCRRSATVIATAPTELLKINQRMISRLHWLYPPTAQKFFFNLMSVVCNRLENATQRLTDMTIVDALTGLNNKEYFMGLLEKELSRVQRYRSEFSVVLMDLDNFKGVNHTYGHETGDLVLQQTGAFIAGHIRKSDHTCRYSGQQFAILLMNASSEDTKRICGRFLRILSEHPFQSAHSQLHVTASMGCVRVTPGLEETPGELMELAARALKEAKSNGKNCVEEYA